MNGLLNFQFPGTMSPIARLFSFSAFIVLVMLLGISSASAQGAEIFKCPENTYTFTGFPEQTLCEQYPNFNCEIQIGVGTSFPKSSLIGASSLSGNVCVVGNFEVDVPFTFLNAVVRINPGVTIAVKPSPNGYDPGSSLGINNSKLFACNGLWKGITLGHLSTISTMNSTKIEDAEKAIYASGLCALSIQQTTFNRNRIGLELDTPFPNIWVPGPLVWGFTSNRFTCDAPLNGTTNEITEAGVKLKNSVLYTFQSGTNRFSDLKYGIYSEGAASALGVSRLIMDRIKKDGIFMEHGTIRLTSSFFTDCEQNGINISSARTVEVEDTRIRLTTALPNQANIFRNGISILSFALNAQVLLTVSFNANVPGTNYRVRGVNLKGGNVGAGTQITIHKSNFYLRTYDSSGIFLDGFFPETGQIDIFDNDFDCASFTGNVNFTHGIKSNGKKNELHIFGNRFNTTSNGNITYDILMQFSDGINNEVSNNRYYPDPSIGYTFLWLNDFQNTKVCSNIGGSLGASMGYSFWGTNTGLVFTSNETYATGEGLVIFTNALTGPQFHEGNKWYSVEIDAPCPPPFPGICSYTVRSVSHARCQTPGLASLNKFTVHTDQSIWNSNTNSFDFFSEFHPENIDPDQMDEFFGIDEDGSPSNACIDRFNVPGGDDELERKIADELLPVSVEDPALGWNAKSFLYKKLMRHPAFIGGYSGFSNFIAQNTHTNIGRFYEVNNLVEDAFASNSTTLQQSSQIQAQISTLFDELETIDSQIEAATDPAVLASLKQQKENKINQLRGLQSSYQLLTVDYDAQKNIKLQQTLQFNQQITPASQLEANQKTVTSIYLESLVNQDGDLNESQISTLQSIAEQDSKSGGLAVGQSYSILPDCVKANLGKQRLRLITSSLHWFHKFLLGKGHPLKNPQTRKSGSTPTLPLPSCL